MGLIDWYQNAGFAAAEISVPLLETTVVFVLLTACLLFRLPRVGLVVAYLFFYRVGWSYLSNNLMTDPSSSSYFGTAYIVFGILVFTFAIIGMMVASRSES